MPSTFLSTLHISPYSILGTLLLFSFYQQGAPRLRITELNVWKPWFKPRGPDSESAWSLHVCLSVQSKQVCLNSPCFSDWSDSLEWTHQWHLCHHLGVWLKAGSITESHTGLFSQWPKASPPPLVGREHCSPSGGRRDGNTLFSQTKIRLD